MPPRIAGGPPLVSVPRFAPGTSPYESVGRTVRTGFRRRRFRSRGRAASLHESVASAGLVEVELDASLSSDSADIADLLHDEIDLLRVAVHVGPFP